MTLKPLAAVCTAANLLTACETYTEKTSPCFGRNGAPAVSRAALSITTSGIATGTAYKDCTFDDLPGPE